ncbi:NADP-dependent alcohol dehydrogenase C 2 [compost metagenome]
MFGNRSIRGSMIGGIAETQEVIDFCARMNILPECRIIRPDEINNAFNTLKTLDTPYRFVIDMALIESESH